MSLPGHGHTAKGGVMGHRVYQRVAAVAASAMLVASVVVSATASGAASHKTGWGQGAPYLALGDSVAFGYTPPQTTSAATYADAANFSSYANDVAAALNLHLFNASCPGETTASMINATAASNGCENAPGQTAGYRTAYPLHVSYTGSQLSYAVHFLRTHPATRLVTIDIGANDAFLCQETTADGCLSLSEFGAVLKEIATNLATIYHALRVEGHYSRALVAVDYYALNYSQPLQVAESQQLNTTINAVTRQFHGIVADGFGMFQAAATPFGGDPCAAGLLVAYPASSNLTGCNIHPSPLGHELLATTIETALLNAAPPSAARAARGGRG